MNKNSGMILSPFLLRVGVGWFLLAWLLFAPACDTQPAPDTQEDPGLCPPISPTINLADAVAGHREDSMIYTPAWAPTREVPLHVWYPTAATTGSEVSYLDLFDDPGSLGDAPFQGPDSECLLPLVLYSHGYQGWGGNGTDVLRQFVRNGWIAAAPDHTDNTLADNVEPHPVGFSLTRVADIQQAIDHLANLPEEDPLAGRIDTEHVLVLGHSRGGQTAWLLSGPTFDPVALEEACAASATGCTQAERDAYAQPIDEPRVVAVGPLDGSAGTDVVAEEGWDTRSKPVLSMTQESQDAADAYARAAGEGVIWVQIHEACHESFTSTALPCDLPKEEGLEIVTTWLTAWGATQVQGQTGWEELLSGDELLSDRTTVMP